MLTAPSVLADSPSLTSLPIETLTHVLNSVGDFRCVASASCTCRAMQLAMLDVSIVVLRSPQQQLHKQATALRYWNATPPGQTRPKAQQLVAPTPWWLRPLRTRQRLSELWLSSTLLNDETVTLLVRDVLRVHPELRTLAMIGPQITGSAPRIGPDGAEELAAWVRHARGHLSALMVCNARVGVSGALALADAIDGKGAPRSVDDDHHGDQSGDEGDEEEEDDDDEEDDEDDDEEEGLEEDEGDDQRGGGGGAQDGGGGAQDGGGGAQDGGGSSDCALRVLRLRRVGLLKADVRPIGAALYRSGRSLTDLSLAHNRLGEAGVMALAPWLSRDECLVSRLDLTACEIDSAALAQLVDALVGDGCVGSRRIGTPIGTRASFLPLRFLLLSRNVIGPAGAEPLSAMLLHLALAQPSLHSRLGVFERLDVSHNGLGDEGLTVLARAMETVSICFAAVSTTPSLRCVTLWPTVDPRRVTHSTSTSTSTSASSLGRQAGAPEENLQVWPLRLSTLRSCREASVKLWRCHQRKELTSHFEV